MTFSAAKMNVFGLKKKKKVLKLITPVCGCVSARNTSKVWFVEEKGVAYVFKMGGNHPAGFA